MSKRNLKRLLENCPHVHAGRRGVSDELAALQRYMRENELIFAPHDAVTVEVVRVIGGTDRVKSYHPGGIKRAAQYSSGYVTGGPELRAAMGAAPVAALSYRDGLIATTPTAGVRDEYEYTGRGWRRVRRWRKIRGQNTLLTGRRERHGRWAVQVAWDCRRIRYHVQRFEGPAVSSARTVVASQIVDGPDAGTALRKWIRASVGGPVKQGVRDTLVPVTARLLRRLCPDGWTVVVTPASQGAAPSPAFRETATGEEYHYQAVIRDRAPTAQARKAFEQRAAQKDSAELQAIVDRGEAAGVYVCVADSLRAGNCRAGTESFAGRHSLDLRRHYRAGELAAQSNGDGRFVRAAIVAGLRRERREEKAGVCVLSDHRA